MFIFEYRVSHGLPDWLKGLLLPGILIVFWWSSTAMNWVNQNFIASPSAVVDAVIALHREGLLESNLLLSLSRLFWGGLAGILTGIGFGLMLGLSNRLDRLTTPTFSALRQISVFAWIPLISLGFGLGEAAKIFFVALVAFFPAAVNTYEGVKSVPAGFLEVGRIYRFSAWLLIRRILLPSAAPSILMGMELSAIYAWLATIGSEYLLSGTGGIGAMMSSAQQMFMMDQVFAGILVSGIIGFGVTSAMHFFRSHLLSWQKKIEE